MKKFKKELLKKWAKKNKPSLKRGQDRWYYIELQMVNKNLKRIIKEIDNRVLDIEVQRKVFDHKVEVRDVWHSHEFGGDFTVPTLQYDTKGLGWEDVPYYSTDIKDAWQLLKADKIPLDSVQIHFADQYRPICAEFTYKNEYWLGEGETESEAICIAALEFIDAK